MFQLYAAILSLSLSLSVYEAKVFQSVSVLEVYELVILVPSVFVVSTKLWIIPFSL